jgi:uracil-DNA glycosylase family 4
MPSYSKLNIIPAFSKPPACVDCVLEHDGIGFAQAEGTGSIRVVILGEALGPSEAKDGLPFRSDAPSGSLLDRALKLCGLNRDQFGIFNIVNCFPPAMDLAGTQYEIPASEHCRAHVQQVIDYYRPKCILALGNVALRALTPFSGKKQTIDYLRGFCHPATSRSYDVPVVASYHPSFIQRGAFNLLPVLARDIKYAVSIATNGFKPKKIAYYPGQYREMEYLIEQCVSDPALPISIDFETAGNVDPYEDDQLAALLGDDYDGPAAPELGTDQKITQVNVSLRECESWVFQFTPVIEDGTRELMALPNTKVGHNLFSFDSEVAKYNGVPMGGEWHDTMLMFHHLYPDIPGRINRKSEDAIDGTFANLQYCASFYGFDRPWKHLVNENPELYGCCDSDATLRLFNAVRCDLMRIRYGQTGPTLWDGYCKLVRDLWPALKDASNRGIPVNREKMAEFFKSISARQRELGEKIQRVVPVELLPSKQKTGLKKEPKNPEGYVTREFKLDAEHVKCKCFKIRKGTIQYWQSINAHPIVDDKGKVRAADPSCEVCGGRGSLDLPERTETRWCKLNEFNPNSPIQMRNYAFYKHHHVPKNRDGKYAMDRWALDQLASSTRDPMYVSTVEYRQFEKMKGYALQWMPDRDGRVHPEFSFYPATGQLSSYGPNCQNLPSLSKYTHASDFRSGIEAPDGYMIVELDLKSFHAQTLGFEANCPEYIRLAKIDVHSYVACAMLKIPHVDECLDWSDDELRDWLKWYRKNYVCADGTPFQKIRDQRAKVGVLAFGLGQQPKSLFANNLDSFLPDWYVDKRDTGKPLNTSDHRRADNEGLKAAQQVHDALNDRFPALKRYRENTPLIAKQNGNKLISRYGCIRWFWDLQHWDSRKKEMVHGADFEKAISFPVQNDGHGYLKYALLRMQHDGMLERYGFINTIHDSVVFCCRIELLEQCVYEVKEQLEMPSEVLTFADGTGLSVECEAKAGRAWSGMHEVTV